MRMLLLHLGDGPDRGPEDEVTVLVPGAARSAVMLPLDALDRVLPAFAEALADAPPQCCFTCAGPIAVPGPWHGEDERP